MTQTHAHEALVEKVARETATYVSWLELGKGQRTEIYQRNNSVDVARAVIALIAEETKEATAEQERFNGSSNWTAMHRVSALWPKETK